MVARVGCRGTAAFNVDTKVGIAHDHVVVADKIIVCGCILHANTVFNIVCTVDGIAIDVEILQLFRIDTTEIGMCAARRMLGYVVARHLTVTVACLNSTVAGDDAVVLDGKFVTTLRRTHKVDTVVTTDNCAVADNDVIGLGDLTGGGGSSSRTTNGKTGIGSAVGRVSLYTASINQHIGATIASENNTTGHRCVIAPERNVLEGEIVGMHQRQGAEDIVAGIGVAIGHNHRVHIITLESDGVGGGLTDVIVREVKTLIGSRTQMESRRTVDTAIVQCGLNIRHGGEVRIGAPHRIVAVQQAVAGITCKMNGIAPVGGGSATMESIWLAVTGVDVDRDVVETVCRDEGSKAQVVAFVEAKGTSPVMGGEVRLHVVLIFHFQRDIQAGLIGASRRVGRVALVLEIDRHRLWRSRNEAMGEGVQTVKMTVVIVYISLVMPCNERRINGIGGTAVHVVGHNAITDSVVITDGRKIPLRHYNMTVRI